MRIVGDTSLTYETFILGGYLHYSINLSLRLHQI